MSVERAASGAVVWRRIAKATWGGRDAHGGVPFSQKEAWREGYDEAMRQVRCVVEGPDVQRSLYSDAADSFAAHLRLVRVADLEQDEYDLLERLVQWHVEQRDQGEKPEGSTS